ncbi:ArsR/SmtB family transcription factor [Ferrovibrio xuzhouensis]|uniref:ArsR/SmtB family transcription factor n=1 Tax=Ferrovibrio xuzhouensis TaxID=1576914 RepID=A0ABV7VHZ0_9PROT
MLETTQLDHTLLALADPTRRAILQRLSDSGGEARVTDLAAPFQMSLNAVSKHIQLLERADLVRRRKQGREHLLSFNPEPLTRAEQWIAERKAVWERRLDALGDFLAATKPEDEGKTP